MKAQSQPKWKQYRKVNRHRKAAKESNPKRSWFNYVVIKVEDGLFALEYRGGEEPVIGKKRFKAPAEAGAYIQSVLA